MLKTILLLIIFTSSHAYAGANAGVITINAFNVRDDKAYITGYSDYLKSFSCQGLAIFVVKKPTRIDWLFMRNKIKEVNLNIEEVESFTESVFVDKKYFKAEDYHLPVGTRVSGKNCIFYANALLIKDRKIWFFDSSNPFSAH